jgi:hypothetical protein
MLITLAFLPLKVSVTLAALLTVILLPWALLTVKRAALLSMTMLARIGVTWRAEAWKTVYLESERRVSELQRQQPLHTSSKIRFYDLVCESDCGVSRFPDRLLVFVVDAAQTSSLDSHHATGTSLSSYQGLHRSCSDSRASQPLGTSLGSEFPYSCWPNTNWGRAAETGNTVWRGKTMPHIPVRIAAARCQALRRA